MLEGNVEEGQVSMARAMSMSGRIATVVAAGALGVGLLAACSSSNQAAPNGSQQKSQSTAAQQSPKSPNASAAAGDMFSTAVPWTADVSGAAPSDRSQAIIDALKNLSIIGALFMIAGYGRGRRVAEPAYGDV